MKVMFFGKRNVAFILFHSCEFIARYVALAQVRIVNIFSISTDYGTFFLHYLSEAANKNIHMYFNGKFS